jgi:hypothetical protein
MIVISRDCEQSELTNKTESFLFRFELESARIRLALLACCEAFSPFMFRFFSDHMMEEHRRRRAPALGAGKPFPFHFAFGVSCFVS